MYENLKMLLDTAAQKALEEKYSEAEFRSCVIQDVQEQVEVVQLGMDMLEHWHMAVAESPEDYQDDKKERMAVIAMFEPESLIQVVLSITAQCAQPTPLIQVASQLASKIGFDDHQEAIAAATELLGVVAYSKGFTIEKLSKYGQWQVINQLELSANTVAQRDRVMFPLPMIIEPELVTNNYQDPYLTINDSVLIGKRNSIHKEEISLDVINIQNAIPLSIDVDFVKTVDELPPESIDELDCENPWIARTDKRQLWCDFYAQSTVVYNELIDAGNKFYMTWRPDSRGRIYAKGYHINPQGRPYKKAMLELANKEVLNDSVPKEIV